MDVTLALFILSVNRLSSIARSRLMCLMECLCSCLCVHTITAGGSDASLILY